MAAIPANAELDLKALAYATADRGVQLVPVKESQSLTGYIRGGVTARCSVAAGVTTLPTPTLPVRNIKSKGKVRCCVTTALPPTTALKDSGSKYFGINSRSNSSVASSASEGFKIHGLPAEKAATAGRIHNMSGPLKGQMIRVTP